MDVVVAPDDPRAEDARALLESHLTFSDQVTPPGQVHALDLEGLLGPDVTFFSARRGGVLLGVGALKRLDRSHAELKSMHTSQAARRQGVGQAMVAHILAFAAASKYQRVSLETLTTSAFGPARSLYKKAGFVRCEPFGEYTATPFSTFMTISLEPPPED
jgi:putative acetyltransferase